MTTSKLLKLALASSLLCGALTACRGWESESPPVHLNWNMDTQEKGKAYRKSVLFADGRSMRTPPAGTVAQGFLKEDELRSYGTHQVEAFGKMNTVAANAFPALADPEAAVVRGQDRYGIYCSPCHGLSGDGDGPVNSRLGVKAPSFHDARLKDMAAGQMYGAILHGVNGGNMGSYAAQLSEDDRWNVLTYVRAMQRSRDPAVTLGGKPVEILPPPPDVASVEYGSKLYAAKGCNACHTLDGAKGVGPTWKGLAGKTEKVGGADVVVDDAYLAESILNPMAKVVDGYPPAMPPLPLTKVEVDSLVMYINTLK